MGSSSIDVAGLLEADSVARSSMPSIDVPRPLEPDVIDLGNLLLVESNEVKWREGQKESVLADVARMNAQLLLNSLWQIPPIKVDDLTVVPLPAPTFPLPREKPVPKPKPLTKWEKYAKQKNIKKTNRKTNVVWDDVVKDWIPRYGYKKAKAEEQKTWMMEIKSNADPMEDPFEKAIEAKREKVAKNELQRLRNIARTKKIKVPGVGLTPVNPGDKASQPSSDLKKAAELALKSTASLGKFQGRLKGSLEKTVKAPRGKKRQFDPLVSQGEKEKSLKILEQLSSKRPKIDVTKAVGKAMHAEEQSKSEEKSSRGSRGGRGSKRSRGSRGNRGSSRGSGKPSGFSGGPPSSGGRGGGKGRGGGRPAGRGDSRGRGGGRTAGRGESRGRGGSRGGRGRK